MKKGTIDSTIYTPSVDKRREKRKIISLNENCNSEKTKRREKERTKERRSRRDLRGRGRRETERKNDRANFQLEKTLGLCEEFDLALSLQLLMLQVNNGLHSIRVPMTRFNYEKLNQNRGHDFCYRKASYQPSLIYEKMCMHILLSSYNIMV